MAEKTTITIGSGKTVSGEVVRREGSEWTFGDLVLAIGCPPAFALANLDSAPKVTVKDDKGNYWTGKEKDC